VVSIQDEEGCHIVVYQGGGVGPIDGGVYGIVAYVESVSRLNIVWCYHSLSPFMC